MPSITRPARACATYRSPQRSCCKATHELCLRTDLKDTHAPHIQQVASLHLRKADECVIAGGAADDRPHPMHVGGGGTERIGGAAVRTGGLDPRHVKGEDRLQGSRCGVAIQFVLHHASPVGPKRSVLTRPGSCPRATRLAAAVSTNGVGPHTYIRGCRSGGQATSRSMSVSMRR